MVAMLNVRLLQNEAADSFRGPPGRVTRRRQPFTTNYECLRSSLVCYNLSCAPGLMTV